MKSATLPSHKWATFAYGALGFFVLARLTTVAWPAMWLWGLNTQRFVPPPWGWVLGAAPFLPFVPAVANEVGKAFDRAASCLDARWARLATAGALALFVWILEDRTWFTGDFIIRRDPASWLALATQFRQAMPLEILLFERLPGLFHGPTPVPVSRLIGAGAAGALGLASIAIGRLLAGNGGLSVVVAALVAFGGHLVTFTGLGKPTALSCAVTAWICVIAMRALTRREPSAMGALGLVTALGLLLHRSGLFLLPCWLVASMVTIGGPQWKRSWKVAACGILAMAPVLVLITRGRQIIEILVGFDLSKHSGTSLANPGAAWTQSPPWLRILDLANLAVLVVPAGIALLPLARLRPSAGLDRGPLLAAILLAAPWAAALPLLMPQQGLFRDLDVFAPAGVAWGALFACLLVRGNTLRTPKGLPAAAALTSISATVMLLLCYHDPRWGMERIRAYVVEAPTRPEPELATTWDFLALRAFSQRDWPRAVEACRQVASRSPSPRHLLMLAIAYTNVRDYASAKDSYSAVLARAPDEPLAWVGLHGAALRLGDKSLADSTLAHLRNYPRHGAEALQIAQFLKRHPEVLPSSGSR